MRVVALVGVIALMSIADLYMTIMYMRSGGFSEGNPIARLVMAWGCPWVLGVWKVALLSITCGCLLYGRRRLSAEVGAWVCCGIMAWLTVQWKQYASEAPEYAAMTERLVQTDPTWVQFDN